jgi:hypothetical protein
VSYYAAPYDASASQQGGGFTLAAPPPVTTMLWAPQQQPAGPLYGGMAGLPWAQERAAAAAAVPWC